MKWITHPILSANRKKWQQLSWKATGQPYHMQATWPQNEYQQQLVDIQISKRLFEQYCLFVVFILKLLLSGCKTYFFGLNCVVVYSSLPDIGRYDIATGERSCLKISNDRIKDFGSCKNYTPKMTLVKNTPPKLHM